MVSVDVNDSVLRITSSDLDNHNFGSSFAFYRDFNDAVYFLTCRHVVTDVGGPDDARIRNHHVEMLASGSEDGLDDLAVLRVKDCPDVPLLQLGVSAEGGSPIIVAGFRRFARDFQIRQIRGKLGQQIGLETRQRPGRVMAWDLTIQDDYDLEQGYSGAPVVDKINGQVIAVASHRLGAAKGVAIAVETLDNIWPGMLSKVQDSYPANAFSRALTGTYRWIERGRVKPAVLQKFRVTSKVGFHAAAATTASSELELGGLHLFANTNLPRTLFVVGTVRADGLSEEEIRKIVDNWHALVEHVGAARGGTDQDKEGLLIFLFVFGCSEEILELIREVGVFPKNPKDRPNTRISSSVIDYKEPKILMALAPSNTYPFLGLTLSDETKMTLHQAMFISAYRFFPHSSDDWHPPDDKNFFPSLDR